MEKSNAKKNPIKVAVIIAVVAIIILVAIKLVMVMGGNQGDDSSIIPEKKVINTKKARGLHKEAASEMMKMKPMEAGERDNIFGEVPPEMRAVMEEGTGTK